MNVLKPLSFAFLPLKLSGPLYSGFPSPLSTSAASASPVASTLKDSSESPSSLRPPFLALVGSFSRATPDFF